FYQFWLNCSDEDAYKLIRVYTLLPKDEIAALEQMHEQSPHERILQKAIAKDVTIRVHSEADYEMAVKASNILFGKSATEDLAELDEKTLLSVFEGVPMASISTGQYKQTADIYELLSDVTEGIIFSSKGEARRMVQGGGVSINKEKLSSESSPSFKLLQNKYLLVQKGKKNYYFIKVID